MGSDDSPSPPSSGKEGAVEVLSDTSGSGSEVDMDKVELPVRGLALQDLVCHRMGSDDSPSPLSSGNEGVVEELSVTCGSRSEVDMDKVEMPVRGAALRKLVCERMASVSSPSLPSSLEDCTTQGEGKNPRRFCMFLMFVKTPNI